MELFFNQLLITLSVSFRFDYFVPFPSIALPLEITGYFYRYLSIVSLTSRFYFYFFHIPFIFFIYLNLF